MLLIDSVLFEVIHVTAIRVVMLANHVRHDTEQIQKALNQDEKKSVGKMKHLQIAQNRCATDTGRLQRH